MSPTALLFTIFGVCIVTGAATGLVMWRLGHALWAWLIVGLILGPLAVPIAFYTHRYDRRDPRPAAATSNHRVGPVDVVVGWDASHESHAALQHAVDLLGSRIGRLALVHVASFEVAAGEGLDAASEQADARAELDAAASSVDGVRAETVVLGGRPAQAIAAFAADNQYALIVIGCRGKGASKTLLGSVAEALVRQPKVPVLVVGG